MKSSLITSEIRSPITYSVVLPRLSLEVIEQFLLAQMDKPGLSHNAFTAEALALIIRSGGGPPAAYAQPLPQLLAGGRS